jgi:lambda family phage portal protein
MTFEQCAAAAAAATERGRARATELARRPAPGRRTVIRLGRSAYRAAVASRLLGDWMPSLQSPDDDIRSDFRILRARARELARSEPAVRQYLQLLAANVHGPEGITLQAPWPEVERGWKEWIRGPVTADGRMDFPTFQQIQLSTTAVDGEAFTRMLTGRDFRHGTALQAIDPDMVDETVNVIGGRADVEIRMGVEVDRIGQRQAYWTWDRPEYAPGSLSRGHVRVDAQEVLHHFRPQRANQTRGVTWLASVMLDLNHAGRYVEAAVIGARVGASQMGFITWKDPAMAPASSDPAPTGDGSDTSSDGSTTTVVNGSEIEADPGIVRELEPGQEFQDWSPGNPNDKFADFMKSVNRRIASGLGVEYHALFNDLESVSYSSAREGKLIARALYEMIQDYVIFSSYQPIYERWLRNAMLSGAIQLPSSDWRDYVGVTWVPPGTDWVDPQKDIEAKGRELELLLNSPQRILRERGLDPDSILEENKQWRAKVRKAGLEQPLVADRLLAREVVDPPGAPPAKPDASADTGGGDSGDNAGDNSGDPGANGNGRTQRSITNRLISAT